MTSDCRVALVTGAAGALGEAVSRLLAKRGYRLGLLYNNREGAVTSLAETAPEQIVARRADVVSREEVRDAVAQVARAIGDPLVCVHCAAVRHDGLMTAQSSDSWRRVIDVNLIGTYHVARSVLPAMIRARYGRIINVVSPAGVIGSAGQTAYSASKAGVIGLTRSMSREYGKRNITVNALSPGFMESAMTESVPAAAFSKLCELAAIPRITSPEEVAEAVPFIIDAAFMTGQVVSVDGGLTV